MSGADNNRRTIIMSRTIRIKLYKFNELDEAGKKVAIEWYKRTLDEDSEILYFFKEDCKEYLLERGYEMEHLTYSLSSSQGDGLSFSATLTDKEAKIRELCPNLKESVIKTIANNCYYKIEHNKGRYCFASPTDVEFYFDSSTLYPNIESVCREIQTGLRNEYMDICRKLEKQGYDEIDYQYTDESIIDNILSNDYEFTQDGKIY
jgi:hypothetical protein